MVTIKYLLAIIVFVPAVGLFMSDSYAMEKIDLKLRLKPGQKYSMQISTEKKISRTVKGKKKDDNSVTTMGLYFKVKEVDPNGIASVKVTYRTLEVQAKRSGGYYAEYDSSKRCLPTDKPFVPVEASRVGQSFVMKVTPKGKVVELKGIEEMLLSMAERLMVLQDEAMTEKMKESAKQKYGSSERRGKATLERIKTIYGEDQIKNMLGDMIMPFPNRLVEIGDSWMGKVKVLHKTHEIDGTYTFKGIKKEIVTVNLSSETVPLNLMGPHRMAASCRGYLEMDKITGWLTRGKVNLDVSTEMGEKGDEPSMSMETIITVEPMKISDSSLN